MAGVGNLVVTRLAQYRVAPQKAGPRFFFSIKKKYVSI